MCDRIVDKLTARKAGPQRKTGPPELRDLSAKPVRNAKPVSLNCAIFFRKTGPQNRSAKPVDKTKPLRQNRSA